MTSDEVSIKVTWTRLPGEVMIDLNSIGMLRQRVSKSESDYST